jgi:hypothetical protein
VRQFAWLLVVAGCSFDHGWLPGGTGGSGDGGIIDGNGGGSDGQMIMADARTCWDVPGVNVNVCLSAPLSGTTMVGSAVGAIDTDSSGTGALQCKSLVQGSTDVCVIAAQSLTIESGRTLSARGSRPLVLLANQLVIDGTVDVSSKLSGQRGPASDPQVCGTATGPSGGGGGAGGSFGGKGGDGGDDDDEGEGGSAANATANITTLRGGCPGSGGGANGPYGGHGGGAVLLIADMLTISSSGAVNASGSAGNGATQGRRGGDGGSSGGMIAISATTLAIDPNAEVFANGGHGGGGSSNGTAGQDGTEPTSPSSGGSNGNGGGNGGDGGAGYPGPMRDGRTATGGGDGGGGGGGGAGVIRIYTQNVPAGPNISPPANS